MSGAEREAQRQQALMAALLGDAAPGSLAGWLRDDAAGLASYRAHAAALAERVLAAAYPTVRALVGDEAFAVLARRHWRRDPPRAGNLALWGDALPAAIADEPDLAGEPYLADVARLDWAVHLAGQAADAPAPTGVERLADADPAALWLRLAPGTALVMSPHPVVAIRAAHHGADDADRASDATKAADAAHAGEAAKACSSASADETANSRDARTASDEGDASHEGKASTAADAASAAAWQAARDALAAGRGENARVFRCGWRVRVDAVDDATARFEAALLAGRPLATALEEAGAGFDFAGWLVAALRAGRVAAVDDAPPAAAVTRWA